LDVVRDIVSVVAFDIAEVGAEDEIESLVGSSDDSDDDNNDV